MSSARLTDAYDLLHRMGPEYDGDEHGNNGLTNHGPMVAEVLDRRGYDAQIAPWLTRYVTRLQEMPSRRDPVDETNWGSALGDGRRVGDWTAYFTRQLGERPWRDVLVSGGPGCCPASPRARPMASSASPTPRSAWPGSPNLWHLSWTSWRTGWPLLRQLIHATTVRYLGSGYGSPVLLVHTATAPNAVLRALPYLPRDQWAPSLAAVWSAIAAIIAAYEPPRLRPSGDWPRPSAAGGADDAVERAAAHGDEHVIKFTDTAVEVFGGTGDPDALTAAAHITQLIAPPGSP
jgi:hypothetical protein